MTSIPRIATTAALGLVGAGAGIGAVVLAGKASADDPGRRRLVSGLLAGAGGVAIAGAVLTRNTGAFGPLLGAGAGLAAAGVVDAFRAGGTASAPPLAAEDNRRLASLKPGDLLPDGVQAAPTEVFRRGDTIRFDSVIGNQGAAPLQLALHFDKERGSSRTTQVIFNEDGSATERDMQGGLRLDERRDHSHLHFDDFSYFQLYRADPQGRPDVAAGELDGSAKQSFYITDIQAFEVESAANRAAAEKLANKGRVDRGIVEADVAQGISVGMADVYGSSIEGQSLKVGDIEPGRYVLRESFDPRDEVLEQDERNNVADTLIEVKADGEVRTIRSRLAPAEDYRVLRDGRIVIPEVVESLERSGVEHHRSDDGPAARADATGRRAGGLRP